MSADRSTRSRARVRAVADAPLDALLARADELARRWALALIAARPLPQIADVPLDELARTAPALCEALIGAIASDEALDRLARGGARTPPALARDAGALVSDLDALRSILLDAVLEELREPPARLVADLADRIASVCAVALAAALAGHREASGAPAPVGLPQRPREPVVHGARSAGAGRASAVLVDELGVEPRPLDVEDEGGEPGAILAGAGAARESHASAPMPRARPWDTPLGAHGEEPTMRVTRGPGALVDEPR